MYSSYCCARKMMGTCDNLVACLSTHAVSISKCLTLTRSAILDSPGVQPKPGTHVVEGVSLAYLSD